MDIKNFTAGIVLGLSLAACAGLAFPYKYYGVDLKNDKLHGPVGQDDLSLSETCDATAENESPCSALLTETMLTLKKDYISQNMALDSCQRQLAECQK